MSLSDAMTAVASAVINPECMDLVESEYSKLKGAIDELGTAISGTLGRQKDELTRTHKTEMRKVQVETQNLSKEKIQLEESIATNERACQLETERDWYKKEALHLDEVLETCKAKQKELVDRLDESEQDRKWMKGQVEKLTKYNRVLDKTLKGLGVDTSTFLEESDIVESFVGPVNSEDEEPSSPDDFVTENAE